MPFLYEMHLHTSQGSACGSSLGAEHARFYKDAGYQGVFITDHFFGGNTAIPRNLPWEERIHRFCAGYEDAKKEGDKIGLQVFFGWEQNFQGDEYLIYGLDKAFLLAHPEMEHWNRKEQLEGVHRHGGCVVQAHPFRDRAYISKVLLGKEYCDGIEAVNSNNHPWNDVCALHYAETYDLPTIAGSDNHSCRWAEANIGHLSGIYLDTPLESEADFVRRFFAREKMTLRCEPSHLESPADAPQMPAFWVEEGKEPRPTKRDWLK